MMSIVKLYIIVWFVCYQSDLYSQYCDYDSIEFKISLDRDTLGFIEPLDYTLTFINKYDTAKSFISPWNEAYELPYIEIKYETDSIWTKLPFSETSYGVYDSYTDLGTTLRQVIHLPKNGSISISRRWIATMTSMTALDFKYEKKLNYFKFNHYFRRKGHYKVRAALYTCKAIRQELRMYSHENANLKEEIELVSNEVSLFVTEVDKINQQAAKWLINNTPYPAFVYIPSMYNGRAFSGYPSLVFREEKFRDEEALSEFIDLFPHSSFTPWAKFYLVRWYLNGYKYEEIDFQTHKEIALRERTPTLEQEQRAEILLNEIIKEAEENHDKLLLRLSKEQMRYLNSNKRRWRVFRSYDEERKSNNNK